MIVRSEQAMMVWNDGVEQSIDAKRAAVVKLMIWSELWMMKRRERKEREERKRAVYICVPLVYLFTQARETFIEQEELTSLVPLETAHCGNGHVQLPRKASLDDVFDDRLQVFGSSHLPSLSWLRIYEKQQTS
jgi:hypothetical protein